MSDKKKKVLVLLPCLDLGGAEKQAFYIARSLKESGKYEVEVWALVKNSGNLIPNLEVAGLSYKVLDIPFSAFHTRLSRLNAYLRFFKHLLQGKFDAIIPYTYHCNVMAASTYKFAGVEKCLWFQIAMEYHIPYSFFEKLAHFFKPIYAANSYAAAGFIANRHSIDKKDVKIVPNPFEILPPKNTVSHWRKKLNLKEGDITIFMAANFFPEKDHYTLLAALKILLQTYPNLKYVFAGGPLNGETAHMLKSICFDNKFFDNVIFLGMTDDIPGLLQVVDIGLLSSKSEGSPNSVIEYMGYGLPVLATDIPAISELFEHDYPFLFRVGDISDFVNKATSLIKNLHTLSPYIERNRRYILDNYSVITNYEAFDSLLSE